MDGISSHSSSHGGEEREKRYARRREERRAAEQKEKAKSSNSSSSSKATTPGAQAIGASSGHRRSKDEKKKKRPKGSSSASRPGVEFIGPSSSEHRYDSKDRNKGRGRRGGNSKFSTPGGQAASSSSGSHRSKDGKSDSSGKTSTPGAEMVATPSADELARRKERRNQRESGGSKSPKRSTTDQDTKDTARAKRKSGSSVPGATAYTAADRSARKRERNASRSNSIDEEVAEDEDGVKIVNGEAMSIDDNEDDNKANQEMEEARKKRMIEADLERRRIKAEEEAAEARRVEEEEQLVKEVARKKMRKFIIILFSLLVLAGGGVATYFALGRSEPEESAPSLPAAPADGSDETIVAVEDTANPTASPSPQLSEMPSELKLKYPEPTPEDCAQIEQGVAIDGEENLIPQNFNLVMDIELSNASADLEPQLPVLQQQMQDILIPKLTGCSNVNIHDDAENHLVRSLKVENTVGDGDTRYAIANGKVGSLRLEEAMGCQSERQQPCQVVLANFDLRIRGDEKPLVIIGIISDAFVTLKETNQLGFPFKAIYLTKADPTDPTPLPSTSPSLVPSLVPSAYPSDVPSVLASLSPSKSKVPSMEPSQKLSLSPSLRPSNVASQSPTKSPSKAPSKAPVTLAPTGFPTKAPTMTPTRSPSDPWVVGGEISGLWEHISLSTDGSRVAVGDPSQSGVVKVLEKNGSNNWVQMGTDIVGGTSPLENVGTVSISGDGTRVAVGYTGEIIGDGLTQFRVGNIRVYEYSVGSGWNQLGGDISTDVRSWYWGMYISISKDGSTVCGGELISEGSAKGNERVLVFIFDGVNWNQRGVAIGGTTDLQSLACDLSSDGLTVATVNFNGASSSVRVFDWTGMAHQQVGSDFTAPSIGNFIFLSDDGRTFVTASPKVKVFNYISGSWVQLGQDLGDTWKLDISGDGLNVLTSLAGESFIVYRYSGSSWEASQQTIPSSGSYYIAMSGDGDTVAVGLELVNFGMLTRKVQVWERGF